MLVIDVDFETMKSMSRQHQTTYFILDAGEMIELYSPTNEGILFRTVYPKGSDIETLMFADRYLKDAIVIQDIRNIDHSDEILKMLGVVTQTVIDIRDMVARSLEKEIMGEDTEDKEG